MQDQPERFKLGESGYLGLNLFDGVSNEELTRELNFPNSVKTYKEMSYHPAINAPLTLYQNLICRARWRIVAPIDATKEELDKAKLIETMMHDMEHTWGEFVSDVMSAQTYGFSIHEKVYRKRLRANGSKFNDGLIGWKKLPIRSQDTIEKFIFDESGNDIIGVKQDLSRVGSNVGRYTKRKELTVVLPKSKFMHFKFGKHRGNPFGVSPLRDAYTAWRYLSIIEEIESHGVVKDLSGIPVLKIPAQYLSDDATPAQKAIRAYYENAVRNMHINQQSGMILTSDVNPETRTPLFDLQLLALDGKKAMDTDKIKSYYKTLIFNTMFASVLTVGDSGSGSFALGQIKNSLTGMYAESLLNQIVQVLNKDLMRQLYELNGWDVTRMCKFDYEHLETEDLDIFSRGVQRMSSVGLVPKSLEVVNRVLDSLGVDPLPEGTNLDDILSDNTSRAGDGMSTPFEGTRTSEGGQNDNDNNLENAP